MVSQNEILDSQILCELKIGEGTFCLYMYVDSQNLFIFTAAIVVTYGGHKMSHYTSS